MTPTEQQIEDAAREWCRVERPRYKKRTLRLQLIEGRWWCFAVDPTELGNVVEIGQGPDILTAIASAFYLDDEGQRREQQQNSWDGGEP